MMTKTVLASLAVVKISDDCNMKLLHLPTSVIPCALIAENLQGEVQCIGHKFKPYVPSHSYHSDMFAIYNELLP